MYVCLFDGVERHFQQYFSYMVAVRFICGGNHRTRRKPPTCRKSLTNFITYNVVYLALVENRTQGLWEGGSAGTLVRGPGSQEGACESLKGPIVLAIGGGGIFNYFFYLENNYVKFT